MVRDYTLTSPSLEGILSHETTSYDGLNRPALLNRIFDKPPEYRPLDMEDGTNRKIIESYFHDLYGILMKKLSEFALDSDPSEDKSVRLLAMLQEFIKVKKLMVHGKKD